MELRLWRSEDSTEQFSITVLHSHSHTCTRTVSLGDDRRRMMERGGGEKRMGWILRYMGYCEHNHPRKPIHADLRSRYYRARDRKFAECSISVLFHHLQGSGVIGFSGSIPPPLPFRSPEKREIILTFPSVYYAQISIFSFNSTPFPAFPRFHDSTSFESVNFFSPIHKFAIDSLLVEKYMG